MPWPPLIRTSSAEAQASDDRTANSWSAWCLLWAGGAALALIRVIDWWLSAAPRGLLGRGIADESAHLLTALVLLAAFAPRAPRQLLAGVVVGAVAIDLDHVPLILGSEWLTRETNRPLTHGLLIVACMGAVSLIGPPRWRTIVLGIAIGLIAHFWRDMATSTAGVPLLWPLDHQGFTLPYPLYFGSLIASVVISVTRSVFRGSRPCLGASR